MTRTTPALLLLALSSVLQAQMPGLTPPTPPPSPVPVVTSYPDTPSGKLLKEVKEHAQVVARVEQLCDQIGPRLTGSEQLRKAQRWAMEEMKRFGAENVHEEAYDFGLAWTRGVDSARLLSHNGLRFRVDQLAWTPATKGAVQGELVLVDARNLEELQAFKGKLKGKILLRSNPFDKRPPLPRRGGMDFAAYMAEQAAMTQFLLDEGALASLSMSGRKNGLNFTSGGTGRDPKKAALPTGYVPQEPYKMLLRQVAGKEPVRLELNLSGTFSAKPVQAYNVVGEIRGSEKPEEVVIVGAHLDSWDLGVGATDNGTGSSVALEVLRAFQATGLKPKRTLRVILFSGEEQGLLGSHAYAEAHKAELDHVQAVIVDDMGTGMIKGFDLQGRENCRGLMAMAIAPLNDLGVRELSLRTMNGTDHASFDRLGVPAFAAIQEPADYFEGTHHSQMDFPDHIQVDQLVQGAQAMAGTAWELLNMDGRLPHGAVTRPRPAEAPAPAPASTK
ncbi:M20/M25/M40 family metallo-hydrolase [Geothrix sp. PMB-07]|uniref:M20/M25/M40 family metallo-hydrolase n=1 Tax=Geothrix sp. PMB-07 TaxID=3068640 RepID=UPI002740E789|nr:M20/M25/M40 family metallo-hydrolase [Geothrix sp. PMB-07]WLT31380.1 M20/M25/M40 family metallo-hydrolase [Geothrix sp. PMB-07]